MRFGSNKLGYNIRLVVCYVAIAPSEKQAKTQVKKCLKHAVHQQASSVYFAIVNKNNKVQLSPCNGSTCVCGMKEEREDVDGSRHWKRGQLGMTIL